MENHGFDDYERETTKLFSRPVSVVLPVVKQACCSRFIQSFRC